MENGININTLLRVVREIALLNALAYDAIHGHKSDDISQNEAYEKYGSAWMKDRIERKLIKSGKRQGSGPTSPIMYSRFEIESLKLSEKMMKEECDRALALIQEESKRLLR